jgi:hypothetical protein
MLALNLPTFPAKVIANNGKKLIFDTVRRKYVALTPEEWVRQHFVNYLITKKGYPAGLVANEVAIKLNHTNKRCDTVVYDRYLTPLVVVEYKSPTVEITDCVFDQIVRYNMALTVPYLILSNGLCHYCCRIDYKAQAYKFLEEIPDYTGLAIEH